VGGDNTTSGKAIRPSFKAVIDSRSNWLVGSSSTSTLEPLHHAGRMQRTFSPTESTLFFSWPHRRKLHPAQNPLAKVSPRWAVNNALDFDQVEVILEIGLFSLGKYEVVR
jgi:hypothetical protein